MSIRKILVGIDFSEASLAAARLALHVARHAGAELHLLHAGSIPDFEAGGSAFFSAEELRALTVQSFRERRAELGELRERLSGQGAEVSQHFVEGYPDIGIAAAAETLHADLVVVASRGRNALARLFLGSVAERVARSSPAPVLIARPEHGDGAGGFRRILAPIDFSDHAARALALAPLLAAPEAEIEVFHAWQMPPGSVLHYGAPPSARRELTELRSRLEEHMKREAQALLSRTPQEGFDYRLVVAEGAPAQAILDRLEESPRDLLVMGSHGRRGFRRLILGSVAEAVMRHARASVLIAAG